MGTSHRHKAGPIGSPNWGKSSAAVSSIANTEKADVQLQQDPSIAIPQEAVDRKRVVYANALILSIITLFVIWYVLPEDEHL